MDDSFRARLSAGERNPSTVSTRRRDCRSQLSPSSSARDVIVNIATPAGLVASRVVRLINGEGELSIEYDSRLSGEVEITAFALTDSAIEQRWLWTHYLVSQRRVCGLMMLAGPAIGMQSRRSDEPLRAAS